MCMMVCSALTPSGASHATSPSSLNVGVIVGTLSIAFALSSWARAGLYCNHQVPCPGLPRFFLDVCSWLRNKTGVRFHIHACALPFCAKPVMQTTFRQVHLLLHGWAQYIDLCLDIAITESIEYALSNRSHKACTQPCVFVLVNARSY